MLVTDATEFLELVRTHNRETSHEIIEANEPRTLRLGYACAECDADWEIHLRDVRRTAPPELLPQLNTGAMLDRVNEHTRDRFFENGPGPANLVPLETIEPEADALEWAHQHINMPVEPR